MARRSQGNDPVIYVEKMRSKVVLDLIDLLDLNENWRRFGAELGYKMLDLERFGRMDSPSKHIFTDWFGQLPTVKQLYYALKEINLLAGLQLMKDYVTPDIEARPGRGEVQNAGRYQYDPYAPAVPNLTYQQMPYAQPLPSVDPYYHYKGCSYLPDYHPHQREEFNGYGGYSYYPGSDPPAYPGYPPSAKSDIRGPLHTASYSPSLADPRFYYSDQCNPSIQDHMPIKEGNVYVGSAAVREPVESSSGKDCSINQYVSDIGRSTIDLKDRSLRNEILKLTQMYSYTDLEVATDTFSHKNKIGEGGFGCVYRGRLNNMKVAIKVLKKSFNQPQSTNDFLNELVALKLFQHQNIVPLLGMCLQEKMCLLHEFMPEGSLEDRLQCKGNTPPLSWRSRCRIMLGASRGLAFLHSHKPPLIHGDIKSANILLDANMEAKLSDFGQARQATQSATNDGFTHFVHDQKDSIPLSQAYLPSEVFLHGNIRLGLKTDTFSFGVVIFECCSGLTPDDPNRQCGDRLLKDHILILIEEIPDQTLLLKERDRLAADWPDDLFLSTVQLSIKCVNVKSAKRPEVKKVSFELEGIVSRIKDDYPPTPSLSNSCNTSDHEDMMRSYHVDYTSNADQNTGAPLCDYSSLAPRHSNSGLVDAVADDPRFLVSDPGKVSAIEAFDKKNLQPSTPSESPGSYGSLSLPPQSPVSIEKGSDKPAQSSESPVGHLDIPPVEGMSKLSISEANPCSLPLQLQQEFDQKRTYCRASSESRNDDIQPYGKGVRSPSFSTNSDTASGPLKTLKMKSLASLFGSAASSETTWSGETSAKEDAIPVHESYQPEGQVPGFTISLSAPCPCIPAPIATETTQNPDISIQDKDRSFPQVSARVPSEDGCPTTERPAPLSIPGRRNLPSTVEQMEAPNSCELGSVPYEFPMASSSGNDHRLQTHLMPATYTEGQIAEQELDTEDQRRITISRCLMEKRKNVHSIGAIKNDRRVPEQV